MDISQARITTPNAEPARVAIHGNAGVGKTTLACYAPSPILVCAERSLPRDLGFAVPEIHPRKWMDWFDVVHSLANDRHDRQTMIIDTVDWLEPHIHAFVCARDSGRETEMNPKKRELISIEDYGFGKGFLVAEEEFLKFLHAIDVMQSKRGLHVFLLMHSAVRTVKNPMGADYDRFEPKCHARIAAKVTEWAENVLFLYFRSLAGKMAEDIQRNQGKEERARVKGVLGESARVVGAAKCAMYDAKNRVRMPAEMELNDPNDVIAHLLGDVLGPSPEAIASRAERKSIARDVAQAEPTRAASSASTSNGTSDRGWSDARGNPTPPPDGYAPAHHDSRKADEDARRDAALAKARNGSDHPNAPRSDDRAKTDSRTWTEPKSAARDATPRDASDPMAGARASVESRDAAKANGKKPETSLAERTIAHAGRILGERFQGQVSWLFDNARADVERQRVVAELVEHVERGLALGPKYRGEMQEWIVRSKGDWTKIAAIIKAIDKDTKSASSSQPSA